MVVPPAGRPDSLARPKLFYGWWVVIAAAIISLWGGAVFYCITALVNPLVQEFRWSYFEVSLAASFRSAELGIFGPLTGFLTDRYGPRRIALASGILGGGGFLLLSQTNSLGMFYVAIFVYSATLSGLGQAVVTTAVQNWFRRNVGRAVGFGAAGYGAGAMVLPLVVWLINVYGWRWSLVVMAVLTWMIVIPASLVLRHKPEQYGWLPDGDLAPGAAGASGRPVPPLEKSVKASRALRTTGFWLVAAALMVHFGIMNAVTLHAMPFYESVGLSLEFATLMAMLVPIVSTLGRLGAGWMGDVFGRKRTMAGAFVLMGIGLLFLTWGSSFWPFMVFLVLFGPTYGGIFTLRAALLREFYGRGSFGTIQGIVLGVIQVGGMAAPALAGWVFDDRGSYQLVWLWFAAASFAAAPLVVLARKPREK